MDAILSKLDLDASQVLTDSDSLKFYGKDWTTYFNINCRAVLFPKSTEEVVKIVKWARTNKVALVPSGGRTGLSGGACATDFEVVVSFEKMNRIIGFNAADQIVTLEPGVVTEDLQNYAKSLNLYYPVDFAARGSSQIGGNIATNAGGIKVVRYGLTRNWITGLEVVTGSGEVLTLNNSLIKNATGYDLRHLFIGSEGTLGFITKAEIQLTAPPPALQVMLLSVPELSSMMNIFAEFRAHTQLVAFEFFSQQALDKVLASTSLSAPFKEKTPYYVVAEFEAQDELQQQKGMSVFETALENSWASDGLLAQSETQAKEFWRYREDISESLAKYSPYKNDISVRISKVPEFLQELDGLLKAEYPTWEVIWFGHIGDGNLHINILRPENMKKEEFTTACRRVDQMIFACIKKHAGSISAEHGVGLTKKSFLNFTRSEAEISLFRQIKKIFDPDGIINPGKVIDPS